MGVSGFGGVLPFARRLVVEQRRWLTDAEFTEMFSLCQLMPGPNIANLSAVIGDRFHGARGAAVCFLGLLFGPFVIVLLCASLYAHFSQYPVVQHGLAGVAAAAAGLIVATALKMFRAYWRNKAAVCLMACALLGVLWLKLPLLWVLLALAPIGLYAGGRS